MGERVPVEGSIWVEDCLREVKCVSIRGKVCTFHFAGLQFRVARARGKHGRSIDCGEGSQPSRLESIPVEYRWLPRFSTPHSTMSSPSTSEPIHILFVGAGAVGCFYASKLHQVCDKLAPKNLCQSSLTPSLIPLTHSPRKASTSR